MMRDISERLNYFIYKRFKLLWILFTLFLLGIFSYINWHTQIRNSFNLVTYIANKSASDLDNLINGMFEEANQIPTYKKETVQCSKDINPYLQHIIINHPQISGLAVHDLRHNLICSTLPQNRTFLLDKTSSQAIFGPIVDPMFNDPIYALQKKMGDYEVEFIIMVSVLRTTLNNSSNNFGSVVLFDKYQKKNIVTMGYVASSLFPIHPWLFPKKISATAKLNSFDGALIIRVERQQTLLSILWHNQILLELDILLISILLYFLIRNFLNKRYSLQGLIKRAIKSGQFYPVYQPFFDATTKRYSGAEVLLRWQNSYNETITPDFFIEVAEETGLIVPITLQIVEISFKQAKTMLQALPHFQLSFNICALHFNDPHFFSEFARLMKSYSVTPKQILFEVTERGFLDKNNEEYIRKMHILRKEGFSLAVDDYGTGHSSISYLHYFPFNCLKIDKLFIQAIGTKAVTETLNDAIINLAKKIKLTIIAEGVETEEQADYLLRKGVRFLQGWYFSKALSMTQLMDVLQGEKNE